MFKHTVNMGNNWRNDMRDNDGMSICAGHFENR